MDKRELLQKILSGEITKDEIFGASFPVTVQSIPLIPETAVMENGEVDPHYQFEIQGPHGMIKTTWAEYTELREKYNLPNAIVFVKQNRKFEQ